MGFEINKVKKGDSLAHLDQTSENEQDQHDARARWWPFVFCLTITALAQIGTLSIPSGLANFPAAQTGRLARLQKCLLSHRWPLEQVCRPCRPVASVGHGQGTVCLAHNVRVGNGVPQGGRARLRVRVCTLDLGMWRVSLWSRTRVLQALEQFIPARPFPHHACASRFIAP